nr:hypothetical protein [Peptostreptococcus anaerobius]
MLVLNFLVAISIAVSYLVLPLNLSATVGSEASSDLFTVVYPPAIVTLFIASSVIASLTDFGMLFALTSSIG